jgi:HK97 family phage portal protein
MLVLRTTRGLNEAAKSWPLADQRPPFGYSNVAGRSQGDVLEMLGGASATFELLYRRQVWVYVVVNKLARACARLPLKTYAKSDATGEREEEPTSAVAKLLRKPWPLARSFKFTESLVSNLGIYGNATFVKFRGGNGKTPAEIWPLPWRQLEVILGDDRPIEAYRWRGRTGRTKIFLPDDVLHFAWFNPNPDEPWGISPLESLATTLALENAGQRYAIASFGNAARPASFIQSQRNMSKNQRAELRLEIDEAYGGPENAFKVALLDNGLDWKPLGFSSSEAQLVDNRKLSREEVCAAYDIPPPMVGILDHATYSNIDQQHWMLYMDTLAPILGMAESVLMSQLIDPEPAWDGFFVEYEMDAVLRGNFEQRSQSYLRQLQSGVATPNELRKLENRPPIDDPAADAIYLPINLDGVSPEMRKLAEQEAQAQQQRDQARLDQQLAAKPTPPGQDGEQPLPPPAQTARASRLLQDLLSKDDDDALAALHELKNGALV